MLVLDCLWCVNKAIIFKTLSAIARIALTIQMNVDGIINVWYTLSIPYFLFLTLHQLLLHVGWLLILICIHILFIVLIILSKGAFPYGLFSNWMNLLLTFGLHFYITLSYMDHLIRRIR